MPGQWVAYVAPRSKGTLTRVVFVPERAPEAGERIPRMDRSGPAIQLRCLGEWQLRWKPTVTPSPAKGARGGWAPSPSGDDRWVWQPSGKAVTSANGVVPSAVPDVAPDYGDEFVFCAKNEGEAPWAKPTGKRVPGSWVTLVDGKRTTTLFIANTTATDGDVLPETPPEERRIKCPSRSHPATRTASSNAANASNASTARPVGPYGRWVPDPFGSKRWAWLPRIGIAAPFALRPTSSSTEAAKRSPRTPCSWFEAAD